MTDKYTGLRAALDAYDDDPTDSSARDRFYGEVDSDTIRVLLVDYDRTRDALTQVKVWISRDEHGDECRGGIFCCCGKYDLEKAIAVALAQEQGGSDGNA